jgi:hypothetical protein
MNQAKLYISFWNICLDNLPDGDCRRRRITTAQAKELIEQARKEQKLEGYSEDDLLAPYKQDERKKFEELCSALRKYCGIKLSVKDFVHKVDADLWVTNPLNAMQVQYGDCLLVITCAYTLLNKTKQGEAVSFKIQPSSIEFYTIEEIEHHFMEESLTPLSDKDRDLFFAILDDPTPPNEALRKAMKRQNY